MKNFFVALTTFILLNSCASILNSDTAKVKIFAPEGSNVIFKNDTLNVGEDYTKFYPLRSRDSLKFEMVNDSIKTDFAFRRKISGLLYLNIIYNYGLGILVDMTNPRRFTYKRSINLKIDSVNNEFYVSKEKIAPFNRHTFLIYTSPLRAMDVFSRPTVTLGTEYFYLNNLSVSAEYGHQFTNLSRNRSNLDLVEDRGHSLRFELKFYNLINLSDNPRIQSYIGVETRFLRSQFTDDISYSISNEDISYSKTEDYIVQRKVDIRNLKLGMNFPVGKRFYFDVYSGFGVRKIRVENPNRFYDPEIHSSFDDDGFFLFRRRSTLEEDGNRNYFNFSLGFKFGIRI